MSQNQITCIILSLCFSSQAFANFALRGKSFSESAQPHQRKELVINKEFVDKGREVGIDREDVAAVIPLDIRTTNNGNMVRDKILLKSASSITKSDMIKNSSLFKTAEKVQKSTRVDMSIKPVKTVLEPNPIEHKFKVDVQAFKGEAKLTYTGYVESQVEYKSETDMVRIMVQEKLSDTSRIAFTHTKDQYEKRQFLQYHVSW